MLIAKTRKNFSENERYHFVRYILLKGMAFSGQHIKSDDFLLKIF